MRRKMALAGRILIVNTPVQIGIRIADGARRKPVAVGVIVVGLACLRIGIGQLALTIVTIRLIVVGLRSGVATVPNLAFAAGARLNPTASGESRVFTPKSVDKRACKIRWTGTLIFNLSDEQFPRR
jgi:hypothetical protein